MEIKTIIIIIIIIKLILSYLKNMSELEQRQYKNYSHSVKNNYIVEIAALSPSPYRWWKSAAVSKLEFILTEWSHS